MGYVKLILKLFERVFSRFFVGDKTKDIVAICFVDIAHYLHVKKKNLDGAIKYYRKAIDLNPSSYYAYAGLAAAFAEKGLFREALDYCDKAVAIRQPDKLMSFLLIVVYESLGQNELARELLNKTKLFYNKDISGSYNQLAATYFQLGFYKKTEYYYREAINIHPTVAIFHSNLARVYLSQGKLSEARDEFQKVLELSRNKRNKKFASKNIRSLEKKLM